MAELRTTRWEKGERFRIPTIHRESDPANDLIRERHEKLSEQQRALTSSTFIRPAKELILDIQEGKPVLHVVSPVLDPATFEIQLARNWLVEDLDDDDVRRHLALAAAYEVPVYANRPEVEPKLLRHWIDVKRYGFTAKDEEGKEVRWKLTGFQETEVVEEGPIPEVSLVEAFPPAEQALIRQRVDRELKARQSAGRVLESLRAAVRSLSELLDAAEKANERDLQRCLTDNALLFGLEYRSLKPKHRLGSEYEMDYALERFSGLVDLVEIEASTRALFVKSGDPSKYLVHAEQQVLDWLEWVEHNYPYASQGFPEMRRPVGFIVIGRSTSLAEADRIRLARRNVALRATLQILTYDDLLEQGRQLLRILEEGPTRLS